MSTCCHLKTLDKNVWDETLRSQQQTPKGWQVHPTADPQDLKWHENRPNKFPQLLTITILNGCQD